MELAILPPAKTSRRLPSAQGFFLCVLLQLVASCASIETLQYSGVFIKQYPTTLTPLPPETIARPIVLSKVHFAVKNDTPIGKIAYGTLCAYPEPHYWYTDSPTRTNGQYFDQFEETAERYGFPTLRAREKATGTYVYDGSELVFTAVVRDITVKRCDHLTWDVSGYQSKGSVEMRIEWQVNALNDSLVLFVGESNGSHTVTSATKTSLNEMWTGAFGNALENILAEDELNALILNQESHEDSKQFSI